MPTPLEEASEELASLIRDLARIGRGPETLDLIRRMASLEAEQFENMRNMLSRNIELQRRGREESFASAVALQGADFTTQIPQEIRNLLIEPLSRGEVVSPQVRGIIDELAGRQIALGTSDIDRAFDEALRQATAQATGRNIADVSMSGIPSTPSARLFDLALQERTRQFGQLTQNVRSQALAEQLKIGLLLREQLSGALRQGQESGLGLTDAKMRAFAPFFDITTTGFPPVLPTATPSVLKTLMPGFSFVPSGAGLQPNVFGNILGTLGQQAFGAAIEPLTLAGLRAIGLVP